MAACQPWSYTNVTPEVFRALQALARKEGFALAEAPSGEFTIRRGGASVSFRYAWDRSAGALRLSCTKKPPLLACGMVKGFADQILRQCGGRPY